MSETRDQILVLEAETEIETETDSPLKRQVLMLRERHWSVLLVSVAVIFLSICLETSNDGRVAVDGWSELRVPELCISRSWFGISCPGCGLTRSFIHLAHGRFADSLAVNRVGWILALTVVLQIPYRIYSLRQSPVGGLNSRWPSWVATALIAILIGNWLLLQLSRI
ncbi:MAG: DUF2752 domain-containing protein [Planctomycetales bacterium]|nr:DUF2752 domain-containing protein [Planctomycetales bacterium]